MARRPFKWEMALKNAAAQSPSDRSPALLREVDGYFREWEHNRYSLRGFKAVAAFMTPGAKDDRNVRRAYKSWPDFRKCFIKRGGRYYANPAELMNLMGEWLCRREGRRDDGKRSRDAMTRGRTQAGRFA